MYYETIQAVFTVKPEYIALIYHAHVFTEKEQRVIEDVKYNY